MMRTVLTAGYLSDGMSQIEYPIVSIEDGRIEWIGSLASDEVPEDADQVLDFLDGTIAPAFFDVHIHGAAGHDVMEATPEALTKVGSLLATHGTGSYLATTVTAPEDATLRSLSGLAKLIARPPSRALEGPVSWPIGIHLEGPFLSHAKRGVHPPSLLVEPDIALFDRFYEAAEGQVRLMTLAKLRILPWASKEAAAYGFLRAKLEAAGTCLSELDLQIAAHAFATGSVLVTNDKVFAQVADLNRIESWATDL